MDILERELAKQTSEVTMDIVSGEGTYDELFPSTPTQTPNTQRSRESESASTSVSEAGSTTGKSRVHLYIIRLYARHDDS